MKNDIGGMIQESIDAEDKKETNIGKMIEGSLEGTEPVPTSEILVKKEGPGFEEIEKGLGEYAEAYIEMAQSAGQEMNLGNAINADVDLKKLLPGAGEGDMQELRSMLVDDLRKRMGKMSEDFEKTEAEGKETFEKQLDEELKKSSDIDADKYAREMERVKELGANVIKVKKALQPLLDKLEGSKGGSGRAAA